LTFIVSSRDDNHTARQFHRILRGYSKIHLTRFGNRGRLFLSEAVLPLLISPRQRGSYKMGRPLGSKNKTKTNLLEFITMADFGTKKTDTFKITVTDETDKELYTNDKEPFEYFEVDNIADVFRSLGGEVSEEAVTFLGEALSGESNGKAVKNLIDLVNRTNRANAKNNQYQKVMNQYKPLTEEKRESAIESIISNFARINKVSLEQARETLTKAGVLAAA
jgi:hypothetical protein